MTTVNVHPTGSGQLPTSDQQVSAPAWQPPTTAAAAPRPTITETPSEAVIKSAVKSARVTDSRNRVIGIIRPSAGFRMRLMRVLGGELTGNPVYFGHAMLAACVRELDGEPVPAPTTSIQIEALVERLDDEGLNAIAQGMQEQFGLGATPDSEAVEAAKN